MSFLFFIGAMSWSGGFKRSGKYSPRKNLTTVL